MAIAAATLAQAFELQAQTHGERTLLKHKVQGQWRDHSWNDVTDRAMRLRAGLARLGLKPGDRVAILSENSPEWVIVDQALLGLGAVVVPLYTTSGAEETRHVITDSGARLVAVNGDHLIEKLRDVGVPPAVEALVAMHPSAVTRDGGRLPLLTLTQLSDFPPQPALEGRRDDLATFIYTSGTTGASKGVMLSHGNLLANCDSNLDALGLNATDTVLSFLPVAHSFERTAGYYTVVAAGGTIAYAEGLGQIAQNLLEIEPTVVLTVPRLLEVVYSRVMRTLESAPPLRQKIFQTAVAVGIRAAERRQQGRATPPWTSLAMALFHRLVFSRITALFGSRLRYLVSGGAPLPLEINRFFAAAGVPIVEGYGLTEAAPVVSCNLRGRTRMGTVGRALKNVEVRTAADGELLVRGANVMRGYYGRDGDTRDALDAEGWLHTGDIAQIDNAGYIKITDRKKEIIVLSGGKNVSPANLETKLAADPYIAQACVIGDRRKHLAALLVPDFDNLGAQQLKTLQLEGLSAAELAGSPKLRRFFQERLREFNRPHSDVEAIVDFALIAAPFSQENGELTPTLKLRRRVVQEHYRSLIEALYGA
ncbi:MAG TPA: long-chain fatty acid--CoA ligase [Candidatus Binataceae bacterium]|nr:long-chain fatty acid--CoA ligase [Candidatus Binataceae bacterium]